MGRRQELQSLTTIKNALWCLPMYHFMLGGRELFHSNFLAWIFEFRRSSICGLFGLANDHLTVEREFKNVDLIVVQGNKRIIIENKFKAEIDDAQLTRYSEKFASKDHLQNSFVVLSPDSNEDAISTNFDLQKFARVHPEEICQKWQHLSYRELIEHLSKSDDPHIKEYVEMVGLTLDFIGEVWKAERNHPHYWFERGAFAEQDKIAEELRLQDMLQKRRAQKLKSALITHPRCRSFGDSLEIRSGFTRKKPLVEAFLKVGNSNLAIGIQIQEDQYRRCVLVDRSVAASIKSRKWEVDLEFLSQQGWFRANETDPFSKGYFVGNGEAGLSAKTKLRFQKFGEVFRYQYTKIGLEMLLPSSLVTAVCADLEFAQQVIVNWSPAASSN